MKLLVSACLLGEPVRYDGQDNASKLSTAQRNILAIWRAQGKIIPICPESLGGLPTPRPAAEIQTRLNDQLIVQTKEGTDLTECFLKGAQNTLEIARQHDAKFALLAARSPSCGTKQIYDGEFQRRLVDGMGVTARLLTEHGIHCFEPDSFEELVVQLKNE